jgi:eukaryotic-like serine/threonine-protein kinase
LSELEPRLQAALGGAYQLERELGGGGMSRVFIAEEVELRRKVVVKVLPPDMAAGLNAERFRREIQLAASLQHPHIVPLIAAGRSGDLVWYTMPLIEGHSLRAKLAREGELPIGEALRILRDVADALAYAHEHGVVHRDIKPDNVLLTGRHAVVTDFGVAKALSESTGESALTSIGVALGTPSYMSPEQAAADPHVDHRADIYALGAMGYELLTGRPPFSGTPQAILAAHVTQAADPITTRRPSVPPAVVALISRCLEKKAADRWQSATELHQQLELMATPSGGAQPTTAVPATATVRSRSRLPMVIGGIAVAAAAAVAMLLLGKGSAPGPSAPRLDPGLVAVMPFRVAGADPSLHYLRQGMVDLLQAKLTGAGGARAADARSVLAAFRDAGGSDTEDVADAGLQLVVDRVGAGRLLQGSIVGPPDHIVMSASLIEMPGARSVAQTTVEGPRDSLFAMVDQLATRLLVLGAGASAQQLAALTTTSSDALRMYLDGIVAYRRGAFDAATRDLARAVELDSTFALALSALVEANGWSPASGDMNRVRRLAWQYRDRLGVRDQEMLSIRLGSRYPAATPWKVRIADRERLTRASPDSPEAWYYWADGLFHYGFLVDEPDPWRDARRGFEEAVRLDSLYGPPLSHLSSLAFLRGDFPEVIKWASRFLARDSSSFIAQAVKAERALASRDRRELDRLLAELNGKPALAAMTLVSAYYADSLTVTLVDQLEDIIWRRSNSGNERFDAALHRARLAANRGRPQEWRRWADSALALNDGGFRRGYGRFLVASGLFLGGDSTNLDAAVELDSEPAVRSQLRAILALSRGRTDSVAGVVARLRGAGRTDSVTNLDLRLAAMIEAWALVAQSSPAAIGALKLADSLFNGATTNNEWTSMALARLHLKVGQHQQALTALRRRQAALGSFPFEGSIEALRLDGMLLAKLGRKDEAIRAYQTYLWWRRDPEPSKIPQRDSVRTELAALTP